MTTHDTTPTYVADGCSVRDHSNTICTASYTGERGEAIARSIADALNASEAPRATAPAGGAGDVDMLEAAWGLIANAWGGDWHGDEVGTPCAEQRTRWREAAERWRDNYHARIRHVAPSRQQAAGADGWSETPPSEPGAYLVSVTDSLHLTGYEWELARVWKDDDGSGNPRPLSVFMPEHNASRSIRSDSPKLARARWHRIREPQAPAPRTTPDAMPCGHPVGASELLPCPFCGSESAPIIAYHEKDEAAGTPAHTSVECDDGRAGCGLSTPLYLDETEAIAAWNRRAAPAQQPPATDADLDALEAAAYEACSEFDGRDGTCVDAESHVILARLAQRIVHRCRQPASDADTGALLTLVRGMVETVKAGEWTVYPGTIRRLGELVERVAARCRQCRQAKGGA